MGGEGFKPPGTGVAGAEASAVLEAIPLALALEGALPVALELTSVALFALNPPLFPALRAAVKGFGDTTFSSLSSSSSIANASACLLFFDT